MLNAISRKLLANRQYDIEFNGYLSNHAKHAIVALDRIHASEERILEWWDAYCTETPYGLSLHKVDDWSSVQACTEHEWNEWRGKKMHWPEMCVYLQTSLQGPRFGGDVQALVREFAPDILHGMTGALTHGLIHLGWGIDAASDWMTIEGLAYLNFCNLGVDPSKIAVGHECESGPLESFARIAAAWQDLDLKHTWIEPVQGKFGKDFHSELVPAGFQWQLAKVVEEPHEVATQVPAWLQTRPLPALWEEMYRAVVLVYLATRDAQGNGNFLILHAITSLWALEHVLGVMNDDKTFSRQSLQQYYTMLVCLLATSADGFPSTDLLQNATTAFPPAATDEKPDWVAIEKRGVAEEEEHNIKLVYVTRELWKRYGHWKGFSEASQSFTLTPNVGPSATSFKA